MIATKVTIVSTGVANVASICAAFRRCGADVELTDDAGRVADAERLVLPGVGSFAAGMERLSSKGLVAPIIASVCEQRPFLAVCLGLQLLCRGSDESPGVQGFGVIPAQVHKFPSEVTVPQMGWNRVEPEPGMGLIESGFAYFANSYRITDVPPGWSATRSVHGSSFVAALQRGRQLVCQFHPELSGSWGRSLLRRWLACEEGSTPC